LSHKKLREKLHGAWLGRCCGCLLGKPVEMIPKEDQWAFLKRTNQWPLQYYMTSNPEEDKKFWAANSFFQNIHDGMPIDDDTNYTVIGLNIVKASGKKFQPLDVAAYWLANVPALCTCTAERVAYRNFANLILPPMSGSYRNPYREWIGAQIRADFFGYVCPGNPELAAELAWRDACISHVKNGIYGEMWVAAMLAASFVTDDIVAVIEAGLAQIPQKSRLHEQIKNVIEWYRTGVDFDEALARIHQLSYSPVHTINNAMIVAAALLWGGGDFGKTICLAVQSALDTDCNGATAGSIIGMIAGVRKIPARWSEPLKDTLNTSVAGYTKVSIAAMAEETVKMIESSE
jgi:ADP-ribosylglycohydrolase